VNENDPAVLDANRRRLAYFVGLWKPGEPWPPVLPDEHKASHNSDIHSAYRLNPGEWQIITNYITTTYGNDG
jgi:hypothetical protein